MRKWKFEFLRKFAYRGFKIARVKSIFITKSNNLLQFYTALGVRCDVYIFKLTASDQSIDRVYAPPFPLNFVSLTAHVSKFHLKNLLLITPHFW